MAEAVESSTLLLVDDKPDNLFVLEQVIARHLPGIRVVTAPSAAEGLALAASMPLDGALLDVQMPGVDGVEMCRRLKAAPETAAVAVVLITAHRSSSELKALGLEAGADDFISRPIDNLELIARVKVMLRVKRADDRLRAANADLDRRVVEQTAALRIYERAVESSQEMIAVINPRYEFELFNRAALEYDGLERERVIGHAVPEVLGQELFESLLKPHMDRCLAGATVEFDLVRDHPKLGVRQQQVRYTPLWDPKGRAEGIVALIRDVTEHNNADESVKKALSEAEEAKERIDAILKSVTDGVIVTDGNNRIILMNRFAENLLELRLGAASGQRVDEVVFVKPLRDHFSAVLDGPAPRISGDLELLDHSKGETRIVQARSFVAAGQPGAKEGTITILRDMTREREIDRIKSEFLSTAAHELRTPLTAVMGFAELLLSGEGFGPEERREFLSIIVEKTEALGRIVDELLDLGRIETGRRIPLDRAPCRIAEAIVEAAGTCLMGARDHRLELHLPDGDHELILDRGKLVQVLENLLDNAVRYSPGGGPVRISAQAERDFYRVSVEDEGIGMTAEQAENAFEKFYRADASSTAVGGLGLGLTVARHIIEAHGGSIWLESLPGKGTRVSFTLPRSESDGLPERLSAPFPEETLS